jgi:nucleoside-diphosphate-sugar epimerase
MPEQSSKPCVIVTGSSGLIGSAVVEHLADARLANTVIGWRSTRQVAQTPGRVVAHLREDRQAWYRLHDMTPSSSAETPTQPPAGDRR